MVGNMLVGVLVAPPSADFLFAKLYDGLIYVITVENPIVTVLAIIVIALLSYDFYNRRTSKEYKERSAQFKNKKFWLFEIRYPSIKDALIFFAVGVSAFILLLLIFFKP